VAMQITITITLEMEGASTISTSDLGARI